MYSYEQNLAVLRKEPKTWLITGGAGYVGTNLTKLLLANNQKVIIYDNFCSSLEWLDGPESVYEEHESLTKYPGQLSVFTANVSNFYEVDYYDHVHHVIHLAAHRSVPHSYNRRIAVADTNVTGTVIMAELAISKKAESFVYASSSSVYGYNLEYAQAEWMPAQPISPYSISKYAAELLMNTFSISRETTQIVGLRFFNIYGPHQSGTHENATIVPTWTKSLYDKQELVVNGDSSITRDFVHIEDVLQGIVQAAENYTSLHSRIYNIGSGNSFPLYILAEKMSNIYNRLTLNDREIKTRYVAERKGDVPATRANILKAQDEIRYFPKKSLDSGLFEAMHQYAIDNKIEVFA